MHAEDRFSRYLLNLDNDSFFAVVRNYLGPVQTPYNKHDLIARLGEFLSREETQSRIAALLDQHDLTALSAVELLGQPTEERLFRFLDVGPDYATFQAHILNLKDRLLIIEGHDPQTIQVNPVLAQLLAGAGLGIRHLIAGRALSRAERDGPIQQPWLTTRILTSLYALVRDISEFYTRGGTLRKRAAQAMESAFGALFEGAAGDARFRTALTAMETLSLLSRDTGTLSLRHDSWDELARIPERWIQLVLWGATLTSTIERAFEFGEIIAHLVETIPTDRAYTAIEIIRMMQLTGNGMSLPIDGDTVARMASIGILLPLDEATASAETAPDFGAAPQGYFRMNPAVAPLLDPAFLGSGSIVVQANMDASVGPGTPFQDTLTLARCATLRRHDVVPVFVLTEESISAARRDGIEDPAVVIAALSRESLPQNVRFLLTRWQARARSIRLLRGIIVQAADEEAAILRQSDHFAALLREELAPGVFLLTTDEAREIERVLDRLDLGSAATLEGGRPVEVDVPEFERLHIRYQQPMLRERAGFTFGSESADPSAETAAETPAKTSVTRAGSDGASEAAPDTPAAFQQELDALAREATLPEDVRQEITLRIERKLILFPDQIRPDLVPQYGTEARGLDYLGKIRLIEQAISNGDMLEVIMRSGSGAPQRLLVVPREIVESGNDLMLRARQEPDQNAVRIRIRRISLVRRLSGTLLRRRMGSPGTP